MQHLATLRQDFPSLRRFGRALTGNRILADVSVVRLMDTLLLGSAMPSCVDSRIALYRAYLEQLALAAGEDAGDASLISSPARVAHWLMAVEEFSEAAVADIVRLPVGQISVLLGEYEAELARQPKARLLIIEDEFLVANDLKRIANAMGHAISGIARTRSSAVSKCCTAPPDLILSDVKLADDSSGVDAVAAIQESWDIPAIFVTAYPDSLLTGSCNEPTFLISKPFAKGAVAASISQALYLATRPTPPRPFGSRATASPMLS